MALSDDELNARTRWKSVCVCVEPESPRTSERTKYTISIMIYAFVLNRRAKKNIFIFIIID